MIIEWLVTVAASISAWFASLFPTWAPGTLDFTDAMITLAGAVAGMGVWMPLGVLAVCVGVVCVAWVVMVGIKLVRAIVAHIPGIGGAGD